jgi:fructokinase
MSAGRVTVIGEALVDLVPGPSPHSFVARAGGSPYNVAIGLARLGTATSLMARIAGNTFGRMLREKAMEEGVDLSRAPHAHEPTTLAVVALDAEARATYDFYLEGTADWQWTASEVDAVPEGTAILHFGSIASWTPPGCVPLISMVQAVRRAGGVLVSYDPNIRPGLLGDRRHGQTIVEQCIRLTHIAKASTDDIDWLYPGLGVDRVVEVWLDLGATLVVITDGPKGARCFTASGMSIGQSGLPVQVADTVGAGDSFTSGLLASLLRQGIATKRGLSAATSDMIRGAVEDAVWASALTCERIGADPPRASEVAAAREQAAKQG